MTPVEKVLVHFEPHTHAALSCRGFAEVGQMCLPRFEGISHSHHLIFFNPVQNSGLSMTACAKHYGPGDELLTLLHVDQVLGALCSHCAGGHYEARIVFLE